MVQQDDGSHLAGGVLLLASSGMKCIQFQLMLVQILRLSKTKLFVVSKI